MNVSLTQELEKFIRTKVGSGYFQNASEVVRSALRLMKEKDLEREQQTAWLQREVDRGWNEAEAGNLSEGKTVKSEMADFKRRWKAEQQSAGQ
jgi:antitoxin ParD1/3/4